MNALDEILLVQAIRVVDVFGKERVLAARKQAMANCERVELEISGMIFGGEYHTKIVFDYSGDSK